MEIKLYSEAIQEGVDLFDDIRDKKRTPIKTLKPWLDNHFPVFPQSVITIGAGSGVGKSFELMDLMGNILDKKVNPEADDYVWLNVSLEMKVFSLLMRSLSHKTRLTKKDLLFKEDEEFSDKEWDAIQDMIDELTSDDRVYISQEPTNPSSFLKACETFLKKNKKKKAVFISIDHIALFGSDSGEGRTQTIENLMMGINDLKLKYSNVIFILLSQLNGEREKRLMDRSMLSFPKGTDLYYSQFTFQISDYVYIIVNPYKDKLAEYGSFYSTRYEHLEQYYLEEDKNNRVALETIGVMYYHLLKCRDADDIDFIDLYAKELNIKGVEELRERRNRELKPDAKKAFDNALNKAKEDQIKTFDHKPRSLEPKKPTISKNPFAKNKL